MYRRLDPARITATARKLAQRIGERFPDSGLRRLADELVQVSDRAAEDHDWIRRPHQLTRVGTGACIVLLVGLFLATMVAVFRLPATSSSADVLQAIDAGINEIVFLGIAIFFLSGVEARRKRSRALRAIHELRSMAHIIDMHQLTKDPERVVNPAAGVDTASSPARTFTPFELSRYLDYCSELLSLLSKSAALYVQDFNDSPTLSAVNEIEDLTSGLARKIWQKIMILDRMAAEGSPG